MTRPARDSRCLRGRRGAGRLAAFGMSGRASGRNAVCGSGRCPLPTSLSSITGWPKQITTTGTAPLDDFSAGFFNQIGVDASTTSAAAAAALRSAGDFFFF